MIKKLILLSAILVSFSMAVKAQFCGTDAATRQFLLEHPELTNKLKANEAAMNAQIAAFMKDAQNDAKLNKLAKITGAGDTIGKDTFIIPVVVHVIHDYSTVSGFQTDVPDNLVYTMIANLNLYYNERNPGLSGVIPTFRPYIGDMRIAFRLATKDPAGMPTKGVTHRVSYLTNGGDNYAKFDLWDPSSYLNIWTEKVIGLGADIPGSVVAAYSQLPDVGATDPFIDGLITAVPYVADGAEAFVVSHEVGHYLGLPHPFGNNNSGCASAGCGDDGVDDTPPTTGEFCVSCAVGLYDTMCATGYFKLYPVDSIAYVRVGNHDSAYFTGVIRDSLWNYPDTANTQNIMTYSQCDPELMFTKGQVARVWGVLRATLASRDSLSSLLNIANTGALAGLPPLPPIADFLIGGIPAAGVSKQFVCPTTPVTFTNFSWNDTVASCAWVLPSYASTRTSTSTTSFTSTFSQPGWVTVSLTATGVHNHGSSTRVDSTSLYVADVANPVDPVGYFQEFDPATSKDLGKYPMFNYYNNEFKWIINTSTGYYDNSCLQYTGFDGRTFPANSVGLPKGDVDDIYTPGFDLTKLNGGPASPSLNFMYSATSLTSIPADINDTLEIDYNFGCSQTWFPLAILTKGSLINYGSSSIAFRPIGMGAWSLKSIPIPAAAVQSGNTFFRFRYKPGVNFGYYTHTAGGISTGNNFFMDRLNFSNDALGLNTLMPDDKSIVVAPNPTNSDAFVLIGSKDNVNAQVQVTDVSGRVLYNIAQQTTGNITRIAIPKSAIPVSGIYLVHVIAGDKVQTEKLVVY